MKHSTFKYSLALMLFIVAFGASSPSVADDNKEYLIKAAFIFNFVKFIEWPGAKAISQQSRIDICVVGDTPLATAGKVFAAASTPKLSLSLVHENNVRSLSAHCHVAFIARSEADHLESILAAVRGQPVLLVSDMEDFVQAGGMIGFISDDSKVKIDVNKKEITSSGMRVDAQLLEIAHEVVDK